MIDTHCHLTFAKLRQQVEQVIGRAHQAGVDRMITVGTTPEDARTALALARQHEGLFATVGLHPHHAEQTGEQVNDRDALIEPMRELVHEPCVVALGEMGLDYHYDEPSPQVQRQTFGWQLELAGELDSEPAGASLPIIIHNREATDDVLAMIADAGLPGSRFVFHCFTGSAGELDQILAAGAMVSLTGIVTFKNSRELAEATDRIPLNRLMVETDSPYLTPEPHRRVRPNEPCFVVDVARFLAGRRGMSFEDFTAQVDANAERFFRLSPQDVG